ncbi:MAG: hypothetical protein IPP72_03135 [Chitinophagaceae bacterium]|nr:hypothetical protein [Chitinophagaceae bacterium]
MLNLQAIETKIKKSAWWQKADTTADRHESNTSNVMLTDHLQAVYDNVENIFQQPASGFYGSLFSLLHQLELDKDELQYELKIIALLHDIGKTEEDKSVVIPHPLTGKPAHKRHGLVGLMAAMEILADELVLMPERLNRIYRTVELHDISYGLFREYQVANIIPNYERWTYINNKVHTLPAAGLLYLLIFKLADIHGHANITDVLWFYHTVKHNYFDKLQIDLPIPGEKDIR